MSAPPTVPKTHPAIKAYHAALAAYAAAGAAHEGAVETAFGNLLRDTAAPHGWTLIPKKEMRAGVKRIIPDGTLQDGNFLFRGYWEAKDQDDDLDAEIVKKRKKGYPLDSTIFEDSQRAVLYQNGKEADRYDLTDAQAVADLLTAFLGHDRPNPEGFDAAVKAFGERVPELALGLHKLLAEARVNNPDFREAFDRFLTLCQLALNPDLPAAAVNEMLVQHLLTERLFRKLFGAVDFRTDNAVAAAVESVVKTLVSTSFSRDDFLKSLDKFFKPIEQKADTLPDFAAKQGLLNTVYERFFQGYSTATADTHGIVYTPQPVVDFMCASVEEVLKTEFGLTLGSPGVQVLDPCTGTGNFVVNLLNRVPKPDLPRFYKEQVFANELMLLPYYIAALNVEHAYYERTGKAEPFDGLCFVDTLDLTQAKQKELPFFWERNVARVKRQREAPITVILGNPPYDANQENENDNNKNRKYDTLDTRIRQTYVCDSKATLSVVAPLMARS